MRRMLHQPQTTKQTYKLIPVRNKASQLHFHGFTVVWTDYQRCHQTAGADISYQQLRSYDTLHGEPRLFV